MSIPLVQLRAANPAVLASAPASAAPLSLRGLTRHAHTRDQLLRYVWDVSLIWAEKKKGFIQQPISLDLGSRLIEAPLCAQTPGLSKEQKMVVISMPPKAQEPNP